MKFQIRGYIFRFPPIPTIIVLLLLPVLVSLGFWQWDRAQEKKDILQRQELRNTEEKVLLTPDLSNASETLRYRQVEIAGVYDTTHQFLIDNQVFGGRAGYFVLTPLLMNDVGIAVLVNRGWIPADMDRSILPDLAFDQQDSIITGRANSFPSVGMKLENAEIPAQGWPAVVQVVDTNVLENILGYSLFNFQLQLDKKASNGFIREWKKVVSMSPQKHQAYAVQWFGLAFTLVILYIWFCGEKKDNE